MLQLLDAGDSADRPQQAAQTAQGDAQVVQLLLGAAAILSVGLLALFLLKPWQGRGDLRSRQLRRFERLLEMHGLRRQDAGGALAVGA